ncbi:MAG: cysteine peptidase family C39 domain-containing protein [Nostoc sp.]|uniref:cysteine peptidase family C39 domain-containing protein n=1 Tax=Nostoc sp. TaxID=1180 RepID=UPI002FEEFAB9
MLIFPRLRSQSKTRLWRAYPFIQQQSSSDYGAGYLAMISQYWDIRLNHYNLRNLARVDPRGGSLQALAEAAQTLGYEVLLVRTSLSKLDSYYNPWVAHWQEIDYILVWRVKGDRILISDAAIGKDWLSRPEVEASWTGYVLHLDPTENFNAPKGENLFLGCYWQTLWHYQKLPRQITSLLVEVFRLATLLSTQVIIDQVMNVKSFFTLNIFAIGFMIWDEATSALDIESERQFQQNLTQINQACITFIMSTISLF